MLLINLLRLAAPGPTDGASRRVAMSLGAASDGEFQWLLDSGLAPWCLSVLNGGSEHLSSERQRRLLAADLVARVHCADQWDATLEILDAASEAGCTLTLLKGVVMRACVYAEPHHRPMTDIDVLLPADIYPDVESALLKRGYARGPHRLSPDHHHGIPLYHVERGCWVELHTQLFPHSSELLDGSLFSPASIALNTVDCLLDGRAARRLSDEMQVIHVACSWNRDLILCAYHPSFLPALLDTLLLLKARLTTLDWEFLRRNTDNPMARASLLVLFSLLKRHGLFTPPAMMLELATKQHLVGQLQLKVILGCLDRYLLGGRYWRLPLPPPVVGRYSIGRQYRKRMRPRLRTLQ